uniref:Uncharacterized protein n=1 Tax=Erpetoichthys calabaricus TaxID=27687 RepID=A0A8C4TN99_ERPCA
MYCISAVAHRKQSGHPFCNHEELCYIKMERSRNTGNYLLECMIEGFQTPITYPLEAQWISCQSTNQA